MPSPLLAAPAAWFSLGVANRRWGLLLQYVTPGCILQGRICLATHGRRLDLLAGVCGEPGEPVRPPAPVVALGGGAPALGRVGVAVLVRPIGAFATWRIDDAGNVAARCENEVYLAARELGDAKGRVPGHDVVFLRPDRVDVLTALSH